VKKNNLLLIALIAAMLGLFTVYNDHLQLTDAQSGTLVALIPDFTLFMATLYVATSTRGVMKAGSMIMLGLAVAYFLGNAYSEGIISDSMLQGLTIAQYQTLTVCCGVLLGGVVYYAKR